MKLPRAPEPVIFGKTMRRATPKRLLVWVWRMGHVTVNCHVHPAGCNVRIWFWRGLVRERELPSLPHAARWADKQLRGLLKGLGVVES